MASFLENALLSDEYAENTGLDNEVERSGWQDTMRPDYESEPPPVTLGEDGNYYANDNRWNYGEWVTIVGDEPVFYVEGGVERDKVDEDQWEYDENGNVVTKDADFAGNGKAINPSGQWMTEQQIRDRWDSDFGMANFRKANPDMSVDDYMGMMKETTALKAQGIERLGEGGVSSEYQAIYDKYGLETSYTGSDGAVYEWNGGGYTITQNGTDMGSMVLHGLALGILGAGISAGIAPALSSVLGSAGGKAASSAIVNLAKQYMTTGELSFEDALLSAALSYGGSELSDALNASGVVSDLASQFEQVTGDLVSNGGDILKSALTAGGMSLVTQMVKDGEIDWKDAALAAAMAGGTTALQGFLADIGKPDAEGEVLEEIKVTAQRKGEQVGDGLWKLDDGTVVSDTGNVLGNISNLDADGDGLLNANDLQEIDVNHDFVDPEYKAGDSFYDKYPVPDSTTNPDAFTDEWKDERYSGLSRDQIVDQMKADGFDDSDIDSYMAHWDANNDLNLQELNTASYGAIDVNLEDPYTIGQTDEGTYYIARVTENGEVGFTTISEEQYNELYGKVYGGPDSGSGALGNGDWSDVEEYLGEQGIGSTGNSITGVDPFSGMGEYEEGSGWITLEEGDKTDNAVPIDITKDPVDPETTKDTTDPSDSKGGGGGDIGSAGDPSTNGTSGPSGSTNPTPNPTTYPELVQIAQIAGVTVQEVISRLNNGETVDQITGKGNTPVTPPKTPETNNDHTLGGGSTGGDTDSGGDTTGDKTGDETGGDTEGGGDNTDGSGDGGVDGTSDTGGNDAGDDTGGTVTHTIGGGSVADGVGQGSGAGSGTGTGGGSGNGEGQGDGDGSGNGNGNGNGNGLGDGLGGGGGRDRPEWGPLFPTAPYRPFQRHQPKVARSLFGDLMGLGK